VGTHYAIPEYVVIGEALPKTVTGKVRKHVLRDQTISELVRENLAAIETA
jgi:acyl-coenzyme A synthetase/AMP-(fatty) acid ligase